MQSNEPAENWKTEYRKLMKSHGFSDREIGEGKQRHHPRLGFRSGNNVTIQTVPVPCQVVNISVGGISFNTNVQIPDGQAITITLQNGASLTLLVDSYHVEEIPPVLMVTSHKFLIGARFLNEEDGYRLMTQVLRNQGETLFELTL